MASRSICIGCALHRTSRRRSIVCRSALDPPLSGRFMAAKITSSCSRRRKRRYRAASRVLGASCAASLEPFTFKASYWNRVATIISADMTDPAPILELIDAFRRSKTMFTAVSLGIFDGERPHGVAMDRLLDACVGLGLLIKQEDEY